jgi:serine protease Do
MRLVLTALTLVASLVPGRAPASEAALPSLAPLVDSVKGAVVNVDVESKGGENDDDSGEEAPEPFFGRRGGGIRQGQGSGFIIDSKGLVLTNNHVVKGAVAIRVRMDDGRVFDADTLGRDPLTDVALIKIRGKSDPLPFVKLGDSDAIHVGDWAVAIGNPFGLASSVSAGIISAKARRIGATIYDDFLQTDAAINLGNSGGPLFNLRGEVIGINTAIVRSATGIGFAVPINIAKALLPQLESQGSVTRGWLGVGIQELTPDLAHGMNVPQAEGAIITGVNPGSPADKSGVKPDDVVVALDGDKVESDRALSRAVAFKHPGSPVVLTLYRSGKRQDLKVVVGTRPDLEGFRAGRTAAHEVSSAPPSAPQKLGLEVSDMDPRLADHAGLPRSGALVTEVAPGSAAERAQLAQGMLIVEASGKPIRSANDLRLQLKTAKSGSTVLVRVQLPGARQLRALVVP